MDELQRLLAELAKAVRQQDRSRAHAVAARIEALLLERIGQEHATARLRAQVTLDEVDRLLERVDRVGPARPRLDTGRTLGETEFLERSGTAENITWAHPQAEPLQDPQPRVVPVFFGTNRQPAGSGAGFGTERSAHTSLGVATVYVPEGHRFGEIGTSWWQKIRRLDLRDDTLRVQSIETLDHAAFYERVARAIGADGGDQALVFIHGFNVTFEDAAVRSAQLAVDLNVSGPTAFFSWPAYGSVTAYHADEATIEASERAITDFLVDFAARCGSERVSVIAHSMGNRGLLRAIQRIAADAERRARVRFNQIILAAPDVDRDLFLDLATLYAAHCRRCTLYASSRDVAVHASAWVHWGARAGYFTPFTVAAGIDTIAVENFNVDLLGHGYFAEADRVLADIFHVVHYGQSPDKRQGLESRIEAGMTMWKFRP